MTAASAASRPDSAYAPSSTAPAFTPDARAARSFAPMASDFHPKLVRL